MIYEPTMEQLLAADEDAFVSNATRQRGLATVRERFITKLAQGRNIRELANEAGWPVAEVRKLVGLAPPGRK